jgi:photosystem II stability/assembly factor-like uncharacterized protein
MEKRRFFMRKRFLMIMFLAMATMTGLTAVAAKTGIDKNSSHTKAIDSAILSGFTFRSIGPALMSGRISCIAVHPKCENIWYVAAGSGGVWKTENAGTTWTPVFEKQGVYSIGWITIDANIPEVVWVGTGEKVSGRHVGWGDGIYKSLDSGKTWKNMGLKKSEHISCILVDPRDSNVIFAAAEGPLWAAGGDRGIFKSIDGGETWVQSLFISADTGCSDLTMNATEPDVLYAAAYQRRRSAAAFMGGGPESGIYKSINGGKTWKRLATGLPKGDMGRIGLAASPMDSRVLYATIEAEDKEKGFYRSADRGESFEKQNSYISGGTGPHYYQKIFADPHRFDCIYQMDVWTHVTRDGGKTWKQLNETHKHSDNHALAFSSDPDHLISGTDGGLYQSRDLGKTWSYFANLPVTQFYKIAVDHSQPFYFIHGGTQDNSSQLGLSQTLNINGIQNNDWLVTIGADGHDCAFDRDDANIIYAEMQQGDLYRYDRRSGEALSIKPMPGLNDPPYRFNWDAPIIASRHAAGRLYFAAQFVFRSDDRGDSWLCISPDLTGNISRLQEKIMERTWSVDALWHHLAMSYYSTISALSESPLVEGLMYAGTDDGLIQRTDDSGGNWHNVNAATVVPKKAFVNCIRASRHHADTVYAALDNHKTGDFSPYLIKSTNRGKTWQRIVKGLPEKTLTWTVAEDHQQPGLLFLGTEFGMYVTFNGGDFWTRLDGGLPTIPFRDLEIQEREDDLVAASFGRGIYILDDYSPLRQINSKTMAADTWLFPIKDALLYQPRRPLIMKGKAYQGDNHYIAANPPFGAVITYYLKESLKTTTQIRREQEKALAAKKADIPFPGWQRLNDENIEKKPAIIITIKDESGQLVRRLEGPIEAGIHRVAWDLRYPSLQPVKPENEWRNPWSGEAVGPLAVPGKFLVQISKQLNGRLIPLGQEQLFLVKNLELSPMQAADRQALLAFQKEVEKLQRAVMGSAALVNDVFQQVILMKKAFSAALSADQELFSRLESAEDLLIRTRETLYGNPLARRLSEPALPSLIRMIDAQLQTTAPITQTNRQKFQDAAAVFAKLQQELRHFLEVDLKKLHSDLEAAGAPWSPGRGVPEWTVPIKEETGSK